MQGCSQQDASQRMADHHVSTPFGNPHQLPDEPGHYG